MRLLAALALISTMFYSPQGLARSTYPAILDNAAESLYGTLRAKISSCATCHNANECGSYNATFGAHFTATRGDPSCTPLVVEALDLEGMKTVLAATVAATPNSDGDANTTVDEFIGGSRPENPDSTVANPVATPTDEELTELNAGKTLSEEEAYNLNGGCGKMAFQSIPTQSKSAQAPWVICFLFVVPILVSRFRP